jgi:hypothetical protein
LDSIEVKLVGKTRPVECGRHCKRSLHATEQNSRG